MQSARFQEAQRIRAEGEEKARLIRAQASREKTVIEAQLADPNVYNGSTSKLMDLQLKHANVKEALTTTEAEWMSAQETLDGIA